MSMMSASRKGSQRHRARRFGPVLATTVATVALIGCAGSSTASPVPPVGAAPTRVVAPAAGGLGPIVYDPNEMADFPCHGMDTTLMGKCSDADLAALSAVVRANGGKGIVELPQAGDPGPSPGADGTSTGGAAEPTAPVRDLGGGIVYDPNAMKDAACHAMFGIVMGRCTETDLERLADELRAQARGQSDGAGRPAATARPMILPGSQTHGIARTPQQPTTTLSLGNGERIDLAADVITRTIGGRALPGYGYNAEVGGPILKVIQGSHVTVDFVNRIDQPTTVHWHGLRHANKDDGVPGVTQAPVESGGHHVYTLRFPDPGIFWYHPHMREDIQQDGGLYGIILVAPTDPSYYNPVDREEVLALDDLLIEDGQLAPFGGPKASFIVMGRFGNTMLVNGRDDYRLRAKRGEVVRFYVVNTANVRPFRFGFAGARMKRVGGDLGKFAQEAYVDRILLGPAERAIVEVLFDRLGAVTLINDTPQRAYTLGTVDVAPSPAKPAGITTARRSFDSLRDDARVADDMQSVLNRASAAPAIELELVIDMPGLLTAARSGGTSSASDVGARGTPTVAHEGAASGHAGETASDAAGDDHRIEWEDDMLAANRQSTAAETRWVIRDIATGAENGAIAYSFRVGDVVKIRIHNRSDSAHPMQHPIHIHGQRFLVAAVDGQPNRDLVWKDTVLVPIGRTVDLVMDVTNPGTWMVHCHIAEHLESGMMFQFDVAAADGSMPATFGRGMSH